MVRKWTLKGRHGVMCERCWPTRGGLSRRIWRTPLPVHHCNASGPVHYWLVDHLNLLRLGRSCHLRLRKPIESVILNRRLVWGPRDSSRERRTIASSSVIFIRLSCAMSLLFVLLTSQLVLARVEDIPAERQGVSSRVAMGFGDPSSCWVQAEPFLPFFFYPPSSLTALSDQQWLSRKLS